MTAAMVSSGVEASDAFGRSGVQSAELLEPAEGPFDDSALSSANANHHNDFQDSV